MLRGLKGKSLYFSMDPVFQMIIENKREKKCLMTTLDGFSLAFVTTSRTLGKNMQVLKLILPI